MFPYKPTSTYIIIARIFRIYQHKTNLYQDEDCYDIHNNIVVH